MRQLIGWSCILGSVLIMGPVIWQLLLEKAGAAGQLTYAPRFLGIRFVLAVRPNPIFFAKAERVLA